MLIITSILIVISCTIYIYFKVCYNYWNRKGLKCLKPQLPFGNLEILSGVAPGVQFAKFYEAFKRSGVKHGGIYLFSTPVYIPVDPEYVKNVLIKDFHHFIDRGIYYNEKDQPIIANLFFIEGIRWKNLRAKLTSTFTSGKMKMMFSTMLHCTLPLKEKITELSNIDHVIDVKDVLARYTTDVIGNCAFGIECNTFKDPQSEFRKYGRKTFDETIMRSLKGVFQFAFPGISRRLGLLVVDKDVEDFFTAVVNDTYKHRKEHNIKRNDFMQLLIELKEKENIPEEKLDALTMNEVVAQAFIFFIAGFDTSATTMTFCLFELAHNLEIQQRVRHEINAILKVHNGEISYEALKEMKYLQQVLEETLRKYPPVSLLNRVCTETYKIPNTDIFLKKGMPVAISVLGLHRDPQYYPNPEKFDPDRFSEENKSSIVSGTYLPFGDGPRICIGTRFGIMQIKIALVALLREFQFTVNNRTKVPLEIDLGFILNVKGGVWLNARKIEA